MLKIKQSKGFTRWKNTNFEMFSNHLVDWGLPKREIIDTKMGDPINQ